MKVKVGVARHTQTKRWHILVVREGDTSGETSDELSFATKAEALEELHRQIEALGTFYDVEPIH